MSEPVVAIVVAAGSGSRLGRSSAGGGGPKALRQLGGVPLVRRSVDALAAGGVGEVVVVISAEHREDFEAALTGAGVPVRLVAGGATRQESVQAGLATLPACDVVLVHDAARPLVPTAVVDGVIRAVRGGAVAVVPVVPVVDSIRRVEQETSSVVDRAALRAVQTPQGFRRAVLVAAHDALITAAGDGPQAEHTDDAAVCEAAGHRVVLVPGSRRSMKITEPADFAIAEALLDVQEE